VEAYVILTALNHWFRLLILMVDFIEFSKITCPYCGHTTQERMPVNACIYFHECAACRKLLQPNPGDCCVFCSFGDVKCPPVQSGEGVMCCE
jgi:hypothetical protein